MAPLKKSTKITIEDEKSLSDLFKKLDKNKDGLICIHDLKKAVDNNDISHTGHLSLLKSFIHRGDHNKDGTIDFSEFVRYVVDHDKKLRLSFEEIDRNDDGHIDAKEIRASFREMGIHIDEREAEMLLKRIDLDGTLKIDYQEWREYFLFHPDVGDIAAMIRFWRHSHGIDVGEDMTIPEDYTTNEQGVRMMNLVTGGIAGMTSRTMTAPLDRLKVMRQVYGYKHRGSRLSAGFKYMLQEGGVQSMWRGNGINVLKIAPETALKYFCYEKYKRLFGDSSDTASIPMSHKFISGSLAGATAQTVIYPLETLKTRMCLRKTGQYKSLADCAVKVFQEGGGRAFYRGYLPNILGIIPYAGTEMALYETCKRTYMLLQIPHGCESNHVEISQPPKWVILSSAGCSSICGQIVSYPFALIRTKMQSKTAFSEKTLNSLTGLSRRIMLEEGPRGFYRGFYANMLKVLPAVMISFSTYEFLNEKLGLQSFGSR